MRLTRLLFCALLSCTSFVSLYAQSTTTATVLRPYITRISPESLLTGADSTVLTINGKCFQRGAAVYFNARKLTNVRIDGDSVIVAVVPGELTVNADVAVLLVENPDETRIGMRVWVRHICDIELPLRPRITPYTTNATMQAFRLTIANGAIQDFKPNSRLFLSGTPLTIIRNDGRTLIADVPATLNTVGTYALQLVPENVCFNQIYTISLWAQAPAITRVNPIFFPPNGGNITITGVNFSTLATVRLGSTTLAIVSISETRIVAISPPVGYRLFTTLSVTNPDGQIATQTLGYIIDPNDQQAPTITRLTPSVVCKNTQTNVTITGTNFIEGVRVLLGSLPLAIVSSSTNQIIITVPENIPLAPYLLSVINPDGQYATQFLPLTCVGVNVYDTVSLVSPNPVTTALTLETTLDRAATLTLTLRNILGEAVLQERHTAASGRFATTLDVSTLANGIYLLEVSDGAGGRWVQKVVKY